MPALSSPAYRLRVAQLNPHRPLAVDIAPEAPARAALAQELDLLGLPALRLTGTLRAVGAQDWLLEGRILADVVQPCVVTLAPVAGHIDEALSRRWSPDPPIPEGEEAEMGDDEVEPLGAVIDLGAVLTEALVLALPPWPRAEGAELPADLTPDGAATEAKAEAESGAEAGRRKPFADLSALLARKPRQ